MQTSSETSSRFDEDRDILLRQTKESDMAKGRVKVTIHKLWWTDKLAMKVPYPKGVRGKRQRALFADGVAAGVSLALNALEVQPEGGTVSVKGVND